MNWTTIGWEYNDKIIQRGSWTQRERWLSLSGLKCKPCAMLRKISMHQTIRSKDTEILWGLKCILKNNAALKNIYGQSIRNFESELEWK